MTLQCLLQGATSFFIASFLAFITMLFGTYQLNHNILLKQCRYLIWYSLMYGIIAFAFTLIIIATELEINSFKVYNSPWVIAVVVGVAYKAIANINLVSFNTGNNDLNLGFKLITEFMDKFLSKKIRDDVDHNLIPIIEKTAESLESPEFQNTDINIYFERALPSGLTRIENDISMKQIRDFSDTYDKCNYFVTKYGHKRLIILKDMIERNTSSSKK